MAGKRFILGFILGVASVSFSWFHVQTAYAACGAVTCFVIVGSQQPVLMDGENKLANQFGVFGLPVSVFIDEKGVVQEYIKGGLLTEQKILDAVARIQKHEPMKAASLR